MAHTTLLQAHFFTSPPSSYLPASHALLLLSPSSLNHHHLPLSLPLASSSSYSSSPFTEHDSFWRVHGGGFPQHDPTLLYRHGEDNNDIAFRLLELCQLLKLLRPRHAPGRTGSEPPRNVFLVGTGPGDPELLTLKALSLMQIADLVLYDQLVSTDILDMVHAGARLLYIGKTTGGGEEVHFLQQQDIQVKIVPTNLDSTLVIYMGLATLPS